MDLLLRPWRHYADFSGRSRRSEYFLFYLTLYGAIFVIAVIGGLLSDAKEGMSGIAIGALVLFVLAAIIPSLAVSVRRMHDQNKSGAWLFISFPTSAGWSSSSSASCPGPRARTIMAGTRATRI